MALQQHRHTKHVKSKHKQRPQSSLSPSSLDLAHSSSSSSSPSSSPSYSTSSTCSTVYTSNHSSSLSLDTPSQDPFPPQSPPQLLKSTASSSPHAAPVHRQPRARGEGDPPQYVNSPSDTAHDHTATTPQGSVSGSGSGFTTRCQEHLKVFFSMHHKLFDLVAFYVVMFAINGQITSLPARLEWIGFCVQSIVALRRAFQTSIKHGLGLTSFLGMLDLLVGQLFLHQDRLGLLPTVANILVYFYVINLTRGLVFGDSVSCFLWFLFGLVDIYRKDPSSASILDLTPYKVIPVHTVGFGLYILMSELVDVMLHSAEPDPIQGRHLYYVGTQKDVPVSARPSSKRPLYRSSDPSSKVRFELCITEITPFTVSLCLNAISDASLPEPSGRQEPAPDTTTSHATYNSSDSGTATKKGSEAWGEVDLSTIKIGLATNPSATTSASVSTTAAAAASVSGTSSTKGSLATTPTPRIISTSDIVIHVNYIPWQQVQYHYPDEQSFVVYGLTPSTDYEIQMRVHPFTSQVIRVGTRAATETNTGYGNQPAGMYPPANVPRNKIKANESTGTSDTASASASASAPALSSSVPQATPTTTTTTKNQKTRKNKKNQKSQKELTERAGTNISKLKGGTASTTSLPVETAEPTTTSSSTTAASGTSPPVDSVLTSPDGGTLPAGTEAIEDEASQEPKSPNQVLFEQLQASIRDSVEAANATKAALKKLKRDQGKIETQLKQEMEGIGRGQAKAVIQDQKRRQKVSFLQESIKQADAQTAALREGLIELRDTTRSSQPLLDDTLEAIKAIEQRIQSTLASSKAELAPLKAELRRLQGDIKRTEGERAEWVSKEARLRHGEVAPLQLRLQRLEQQEVVWKVAAEASKEKDREASLRTVALEEDAQKKTLKAQELETAIQELKEKNIRIKESVEQELEALERLERESDADVVVQGTPFSTQSSIYASPQFSSASFSQPPHHLDGSVDGSLHDPLVWLPVESSASASNGHSGTSSTSTSSAWPSSGISMGGDSYARPRTTGQQNILDLMGGGDSRPWWDVQSTPAAALNGSKTTRTTSDNTTVLNRGLPEWQ
ncbi:MAG: hypothetical protein J3Q66DRAFT_361097 [Benniella sp.]|nr:MAG: hypothetical protein J3Q66DRAFT_361097 [Benniella sp.]